MRRRKSDLPARVNRNLPLEFDDVRLTSYAGLELLERYLRTRRFNQLVRDPAPQGFLGHLIAREYSQEACRNGEARSRCGGGGGSPLRATGDAAGNGRGGRFSARRKRETVLRLLRGEDLESVSRELGITAARASQWRDQFLAAGQASLKSRAPDARDEANRRLQAKIGELLMENELLYAKVDQLEAAGPLARRRSRR